MSVFSLRVSAATLVTCSLFFLPLDWGYRKSPSCGCVQGIGILVRTPPVETLLCLSNRALVGMAFFLGWPLALF